jgi:hypothetical protein
MAGVAKHLKGFPWRYGVGRAGSTAVNGCYSIGEWDAISGCRFRSTQIENLNRRDPVPGSAEPGIRGKIFMDTVYPSAIGARQINRIFAAKGALRQYDR